MWIYKLVLNINLRNSKTADDSLWKLQTSKTIIFRATMKLLMAHIGSKITCMWMRVDTLCKLLGRSIWISNKSTVAFELNVCLLSDAVRGKQWFWMPYMDPWKYILQYWRREEDFRLQQSVERLMTITAGYRLVLENNNNTKRRQ